MVGREMMDAPERWRDNWRVLVPRGTLPVDVPRGGGKRRAVESRVRSLPSGTPVMLLARSFGSLRRCRSFADAAGLEVEGEYLPLPSTRAAAYLIENAPESVAYFWTTLATAPPGARGLSAPIEVLLKLARDVIPWSLLGAMAPGCAVVGRRT